MRRVAFLWGCGAVQLALAAGAPIELYVAGETTQQAPLARLEPLSGCYVGVWADLDSPAGRNDLQRLKNQVGPHAVYFRYNFFRDPADANPWSPFFPDAFVKQLAGSTAAIHLAVEPRIPLQQVTEPLVRLWAQQANATGKPIFMRWASEFNDKANPWSKNPALYREKFRLVARIMHEEAPNVAMVWTPMAFHDLKSVIEYYPGREFVDWVGLTVYSKYYWNGDRRKVTWDLLPTRTFDTLYRTFADRHPIQVSEYAAEHHNGALKTDLSGFATLKMQQVYYNIMLKYPRVKNINWLNFDMTTAAGSQGSPASRRANYHLLKSPQVLSTYASLLREPYFLKRFGDSSTVQYLPFPDRLGPSSEVLVAVNDARVRQVEYFLDGKRLARSTVMPYRVQLGNLKGGTHTLKAVANVGPAVTRTFRVQ